MCAPSSKTDKDPPKAHPVPTTVRLMPSSGPCRNPKVLLLLPSGGLRRAGCIRSDPQGQPQEAARRDTTSQAGALGPGPEASERLVRSAGLGVPGSRLADDAVRVLAAATWAAQAVVAALDQLHAACGGQVAEQAGQHQGEGAHEGPAGTAV